MANSEGVGATDSCGAISKREATTGIAGALALAGTESVATAGASGATDEEAASGTAGVGAEATSVAGWAVGAGANVAGAGPAFAVGGLA